MLQEVRAPGGDGAPDWVVALVDGHRLWVVVRLAAFSEVQQRYYVTGQADFVLVVLTAGLAAYEAFTRRDLLADGG